MYLCLYERGIKSIITTWRAAFRGAAHATAICGAINKRGFSFADVYLNPLALSVPGPLLPPFHRVPANKQSDLMRRGDQPAAGFRENKRECRAKECNVRRVDLVDVDLTRCQGVLSLLR